MANLSQPTTAAASQNDGTPMPETNTNPNVARDAGQTYRGQLHKNAVRVTHRTLSDGSQVHAVVITDEDGQAASFECRDYERAYSAKVAIEAHLEAAAI